MNFRKFMFSFACLTPIFLNRYVHTDLLELLSSNLCNIHTNLISCTYTDYKTDFFSVPVIEAILSHLTSGLFQNCFCIFRIIVIVL